MGSHLMIALRRCSSPSTSWPDLSRCCLTRAEALKVGRSTAAVVARGTSRRERRRVVVVDIMVLVVVLTSPGDLMLWELLSAKKIFEVSSVAL